MQPKSTKGKRTDGSILEFILFFVWILSTGYIGYYFGSQSGLQLPCPPVEDELIHTKVSDCSNFVNKNSYNELNDLRMSWACSKAKFNASIPMSQPTIDLKRTMWKSIIYAEPYEFSKKYLSHYPGDLVISQPVVILSHKPLNSFSQIDDVCKVLDIAIVSDSPGVCVAISETYHDVASYHMLHAAKDANGKLTMSSNPVQDRNIPSEEAYEFARKLLLEYFEHTEGVNKAFKAALPNAVAMLTKTGGSALKKGGLVMLKPAKKLPLLVGCVILNLLEYELLLNSMATLEHSGGSKKNVVIVTPVTAVYRLAKLLPVKLVYVPAIDRENINITTPQIRRAFLQAWMVYSAAELGMPILWQSPGTIWLQSPDVLYSMVPPETEFFAAYKGRGDVRASPFFISYDFIWVEPSDRPIHFVHEVMLHIDLVSEWNSVDAVASYRLGENNAR